MEQHSKAKVAGISEEILASTLAEEEFAAQEANYNHITPSANDEEYENQEWVCDLSEKCNLIVNYLPHELDDLTLKVQILPCSYDIFFHNKLFFTYVHVFLHSQNLFAEHGDIAVAKVVKDKISKKNLGYGFVKFMREDDANAAIEAKNGFLMGHKKLKVSLARPPSVEIRNCKLYITNLPKEFSEREVVDLFSKVNIFKNTSVFIRKQRSKVCRR
jgi:hypothetical protein